MVATEQSFPRGGKKPRIQFNEKKKFDFLSNSDKIGKRKRYKPKVIKETEEKDLDYLSDASSEPGDEIKAKSTDRLFFKTIREGMTILGRVQGASETQIKVSLPGRMFGYVTANNISCAYTKLLQSYVDNESDDIKRLPEFFDIGEYVSVVVLSVTNYENNKIKLDCSMLPQDVNRGLLHNNILEGTILRGSVESIEDHGYIIDLGVPHSRSFLPQKYAEPNFELCIGKVIWCIVKKNQKSSTDSIITVSNKIEHINSTTISGKSALYTTVNDLKPGMPLNFFVNKPLKDGAEGSVLTDINGYIHVSQIKDKLRTGKSVKAYFLYLMPITKLPFFTTKDIFQSFNCDIKNEAAYDAGQIIDDAVVINSSEATIVFKIDNGIAVMNSKYSQCNNLTEGSVKEFYTKGSTHRIRILNYCPSDYAYMCTDKEEILKEKYFSLNDFKIGDIVEGVVHKILASGVLIKIHNTIGWISNLHLTDAGLHQSSSNDNTLNKYISKKYKIGQTVKARVLSVDVSKNNLKLIGKLTFLSQDIEILKEYKDANVGKWYKGVIVHYLRNSAIVSFFGNVQAIVPREEMSSEKITNIQDVFNLGQVVNCRVISVDIENEKMLVSFCQNPESDLEKTMDCMVKNIDNEVLQASKLENKKRKKEKRKKENSDCELPCSSDGETVTKKSKKSKRDEKNSNIKKDLTSINAVINVDSLQSEKSKKKKKKNDSFDEEMEENNYHASSSKSDVKLFVKKTKKSEKKLVEETLNQNENSQVSVKKKKNSNIEKMDENNYSYDSVTLSPKDSSNNETPKTSFSSMKQFWQLDNQLISKNILNKAEESSSSDSEVEMVEEKTKKKKKKLTNAEKVEKARQEEETLRNIEKELLTTESQPRSSDQFDRLLLANPNNSELWIAYMAFHLQATEIERARAIARKAISTISFREEQDKLNIWLALLNLENRFGTKESLNATLQEALQTNDRYQIHSKMLNMYAETGKLSELSLLIDIMLSKYKSNPQVYAVTGEVCYKVNMIEKARAIMQKAMSRLDNKKHVPILIKFAHLENNNGDSERAETIFEKIIGCLPLRVDVWCVYIDMLTKGKKIDNARLIFERAISQKMPPRKIKVLFKKWIEMEEKDGNADEVKRVRHLAMEYIEKQK